jgi:hypothetical protein
MTTAIIVLSIVAFIVALVVVGLQIVRRAIHDIIVNAAWEQRCKTLKEELSLHETASFAAQKEIAKLHVEIVNLRRKTGREVVSGDLKVAVVPTFDQKTRDLVALALNNPADKEAAAAAMIVCKRLRKEYGA